MIPYGLNPHGLEDRTLTFVVLENNNIVYSCQSKNRLYCWAEVPQAVKNYIMTTYQKGEGEVQFSTSVALDEASWIAKPKYVSKEQAGNHFMVDGDQTFYWQIWISSGVIPDFATVYVVDTSGSMAESDYTQVKKAMTGEIYEYNRYDYTMHDSKMYLYSADKLANMQVNDSVFGTIPFGNASLTQIWDVVSPFVDGLSGSRSESMITNLYYAIGNMVYKLFYGEHATPLGRSCELSAVSFIMFTDESIFTSDTLDDKDFLYDSSKPSKNPGQWYSQWFKDWRDNSTYKFPTPKSVPSNSSDKWNFCYNITAALKQMSYYYGVTFTWGLYGGLAVGNDKSSIADKFNSNSSISYGTATWLNKVRTLTTGASEKIEYDYGVAWDIPRNFYVEYPHEAMCMIVLDIPSMYIAPGQNALTDDIIMKYDDQFDISKIRYHFHKDSPGQYSAFRFLKNGSNVYVPNEKDIYLPSMSQMNLVAIEPTSQYIWTLRGRNTPYQCGATYTVDANDVSEHSGSRPVIYFVLGVEEDVMC